MTHEGKKDKLQNGNNYITRLQAALAYARQGWVVIPLHTPDGEGHCSCHIIDCQSPGKHPRTNRGVKEATTDEEQIRKWWTMWPHANIGVATGTRSGALVIDIDSRHGGKHSLETLQEEFEWPDTIISKTGDGWHFIFSYPTGQEIRSSSGKLGQGIDVRADGGYFVAPPSLHISGEHYRWEHDCSPDDLRPAVLPPKLLELLRQSRCESKKTNGIGERIPEGERNETLASLAGSMRRRGMVESEIVAALLAVNHNRCMPSLPDSEVRQIAASIGRYDAGYSTGNFSSDYKHPPPEVTLLQEIGAAELQRNARENGTGNLDFLPLLGQTGYFVGGWSYILAGYPKSGKTELMVRVVGEWQNERILYITEEPELLWAVRLTNLPDCYGHMTLLFALGASTLDIRDRVANGGETVIVVDTIRNLLGFQDENDNSEIAKRLIPWVALGREKGKTVIFVHHNRKGGGGHGEGISGGHAFLGVVDVALEVTRYKEVKRRRLLQGVGRLIQIPDMVYEMLDTGEFRYLGNPASLTFDQVRKRCLTNLTEEWQTTSAIRDILGEPTPSGDQIRSALKVLAEEGKIERDPPISKGDKRGKTYRWRSASNLLWTPSPIGGSEVKQAFDL